MAPCAVIHFVIVRERKRLLLSTRLATVIRRSLRFVNSARHFICITRRPKKSAPPGQGLPVAACDAHNPNLGHSF
jgi:hypothetical protein